MFFDFFSFPQTCESFDGVLYGVYLVVWRNTDKIFDNG